MKRYLILAMLWPLVVFGQLSWKTSQGEFSVEVVIPHETIALADPLAVHLTVTYPKSYHINLDDLKSNLLKHSSIQPDPFVFLAVHESTQPLANERSQQRVEFTLQPQLIGEFPLTFRTSHLFRTIIPIKMKS